MAKTAGPFQVSMGYRQCLIDIASIDPFHVYTIQWNVTFRELEKCPHALRSLAITGSYDLQPPSLPSIISFFITLVCSVCTLTVRIPLVPLTTRCGPVASMVTNPVKLSIVKTGSNSVTETACRKQAQRSINTTPALFKGQRIIKKDLGIPVWAIYYVNNTCMVCY